MRSNAHPQLNFAALIHRIQPQPRELASAKQHRGTVRARLQSSFDVSRFAIIGSHARATAVRSYSDVDLLVALRRNEAKWGGDIVKSSTVLSRVRDDLASRFPRTGVRSDEQAAVVGFADGEQSLDVVPALFLRFDKSRPVYSIPDGNSSWMETSPESHDQFFGRENEASGSKLSRVAQLIKWWKYSRATPIPIRSFYVDMVMADSDLFTRVQPYTHLLYQAFGLFSNRECRGLRDPLGLSGIIYGAKTQAQADEIVRAVEHAFDHSKAAVAAEAVRDFEEANRQWNIVFNGDY